MKELIIIFALILTTLTCRNNDDVLAATRHGVITRAEFEEWLESKNIQADSLYKQHHSISDYLRQLAIEKLTAVKAGDAGFENDISYQIIEKNLYRNLLSTYFINEQIRKMTFNENAVELNVISFAVLNKKGEQAFTAQKLQMDNAYSAISRLKSGTDFNVLARYYSVNATDEKLRAEVIPESQLDEKVKTAVSKLDENQYTPEPVVVGNSVYLIKLNKRYNLTDKNIRIILSDKDNADKIVKYYERKLLENITNHILTMKKVINNTYNLSFKNKQSIIFSIDDEAFTVAELDVLLRIFSFLKYGLPLPKVFTIDEKRVASGKIFKERLFASEAEINQLVKSQELKRDWFYQKRAALAGAYKYNFLIKDLTIMDSEVKKEYDQNKFKKYYIVKKINNKEIKSIIPYYKSYDLIRNQMYREKLKSLKKNWDDEILKEGNYQILDKNF